MSVHSAGAAGPHAGGAQSRSGLLERTTIRTKLIVLMVGLQVLLAGLGAFSILRLNTVGVATSYLAEEALPATALLGQFNVSTAHYRRLVQQHILTPDAAGKQAIQGRMAERVEEVEKAEAAYREMIRSEKGRAMFEAADAAWKEYRDSSQAVIRLSNQGQAAQAAQLSLVGLRERGGTLEKTLGDLVAYRQQQGDEHGAQAEALISLSWKLIAAIMAVALVVGFAGASMVVRSINGGLNAIIKPMGDLSKGDLSAHVPFRGLKTELGALAEALQIFKDALIEKKRLDEAGAAEAAAKIERGRKLEQLMADFETKVGSLTAGLSAAATEMEATAREMTGTAEQATRQTVAASAATEEASANVQTVAGAAEELAASIREIASQVAQASDVAGRAVSEAQETDVTVQALAEAANQIGEIVQLISSIASQTNLLALNATIEAARAGEAGRGFAVVANEVKALATQTGKATDDITAQINAIQASTDRAVQAIARISVTIGDVSNIASSIASAVEEQRAATAEIARNVQEAASGTSEVSSNVTGLQAAASGTGAAATQVLTAAGELAQQSETLSAEVATFLAQVKAA